MPAVGSRSATTELSSVRASLDKLKQQQVSIGAELRDQAKALTSLKKAVATRRAKVDKLRAELARAAKERRRTKKKVTADIKKGR